MSDDASTPNPPASSGHLPHGVNTIVIPFTWSGRQRRRSPSQRSGVGHPVTESDPQGSAPREDEPKPT